MAHLRTDSSHRDGYNPLRGLTMTRIVAMEEAAGRGDIVDLQWFWHHMIQTDVTVAAAVSKRLSHIGALDWEIRVMENADPVLAAEQKDVLRYAYDRIANLKEATQKLALGMFTGFSILEKVRAGYGPLISKLEWIPPWYWTIDRAKREYLFNERSIPGTGRGEMVNRRELVIHEPGDPLFKSIGRHFFAKQLAMADWDVALENGANQPIFIIGPPGTTPEKELEYQTLAESVTSNLRGYMPNGSTFVAPDLAARSRLPYFERIEYSDKQIVLAATGGLLTMLTESGSGTLAGGAHSETLMTLARADANKISETYQQSIDREILNAFFPNSPVVVYFQYDLPQKTESMADLMEAASSLSWSGYRIDKQMLEEKSGLKLEFMDPALAAAQEASTTSPPDLQVELPPATVETVPVTMPNRGVAGLAAAAKKRKMRHANERI